MQHSESDSSLAKSISTQSKTGLNDPSCNTLFERLPEGDLVSIWDAKHVEYPLNGECMPTPAPKKIVGIIKQESPLHKKTLDYLTLVDDWDKPILRLSTAIFKKELPEAQRCSEILWQAMKNRTYIHFWPRVEAEKYSVYVTGKTQNKDDQAASYRRSQSLPNFGQFARSHFGR